MAGIVLGSNFDVQTGLPLDGRLKVADITARNAIPAIVRYEGMLVYVVADATNYQLIGGILDANWEELSGAGGSGGINYIANGSFEKDIAGVTTYIDYLRLNSTDVIGNSMDLMKLSSGGAVLAGDLQTSHALYYTGTVANGGLALNTTYYTTNVTGYGTNFSWSTGLSSALGGSVIDITSSAGNGLSGFLPFRPISGANGNYGAVDVTVSHSTVNPLMGVGSLVLTKPASNCLGQGWAIPFTIDRGLQGQVVAINHFLEVMSGTFVTGDCTYWIYDTVNKKMIQPSGFEVVNNAVGGPAQQMTFQSSINSTTYKLILHVSSISALAYSLKFDDIVVGPQIKTTGVRAKSVTMQTFGPGTSGTYNRPANVYMLKVRMVGPGGGGSSSGATAGSAGSAATTFGTGIANPGNGGASNAAGSPGVGILGTGWIGTVVTGGMGNASMYTRSNQDVAGGAGGASMFGGGGGGGPYQGGSTPGYDGQAWGSGGGGGGGTNLINNYFGTGGSAGGGVDAYIPNPASSYAYSVGTGGAGGVGGGNSGGAGKGGYIEITEYYYGDNVVLSDSAATRAVNFVTGPVVPTSSQVVGSWTTITLTALHASGKDTHGCYNPLTGEYRVKVPGAYPWQATLEVTRASGAVTNASAVRILNLTKGIASTGAPGIWVSAGSELMGLNGAGQIQADTGDILVYQIYHSGGSGFAWANAISATQFSLQLDQGPSQIQAATTVMVDADSPTSVHYAVSSVLTGWTKREDPLNCLNAATGEFTAPAPGFYIFQVSYAPQNTALPSSVYAYFNGSPFPGPGRRGSGYSNGAVYPNPVVFGGRLLAKGEKLSFYAQNSSGGTTATDGAGTVMLIYRLGSVT